MLARGKAAEESVLAELRSAAGSQISVMPDVLIPCMHAVFEKGHAESKQSKACIKMLTPYSPCLHESW